MSANNVPADDFLVEIRTEELPPKALKELLKSFAATIKRELDNAGLAYKPDAMRIFATPRRLAVHVIKLGSRQADRLVEKQGPFVAQAFTSDGQPSPAASGFARSNGVTVEELARAPSDKGERLVFRATEKGRTAVELLPAIVEKALAELPIPKRMRWGSHRAEFVRPVHSVVMLYGKDVIDCEILGQRAGRITRGHRFHADVDISIPQPADYQKLLLEHKVVACFKVRRERIEAQAKKLAADLGGDAVYAAIPPDLLDEVTALVEWPVALVGKFDEAFLTVPHEALIASMSEHQKYFHLLDSHNKLLPYFITIANIDSTDPAQVIAGNERVIRPRLSDAKFFYENDLKTPLIERREKLKSVVFQAGLGTLFDKTERLAKLAMAIVTKIKNSPNSANAPYDVPINELRWARRAGHLSKADLLSDMVLEFASMQGIAGSYCAAHDDEPKEVVDALREQYLPRFAGDALPKTLTGTAQALADRLDTLVGVFGIISQIPSGSKDPFALRRASIAVLNILIEGEYNLDLLELLNDARYEYKNDNAQVFASLTLKSDGDPLLGYMLNRLRGICQEKGIANETFNAVLIKELTAPLDIHRRVQAVHAFRQLPEAAALAAANKRVSNLLAKSAAGAQNAAINPALLFEPAEKALDAELRQKEADVAPLFAARNYIDTLTALASLRAPVDAFFEQVMVMVDDEPLRNNRLALLKKLQALFLQVADIAQLS